METTQMRFKDLLVSDLGPLPADATINEDLYDLLTLPYSLGTDMNSRFMMYRYHGDDSRNQRGHSIFRNHYSESGHDD